MELVEVAVKLLTAASATAVETGSDTLEYSPIPAAVIAAILTVYDWFFPPTRLGRPES
jgi:hypothetical protein